LYNKDKSKHVFLNDTRQRDGHSHKFANSLWGVDGLSFLTCAITLLIGEPEEVHVTAGWGVDAAAVLT
jgi:hypothetical protein